MTKRFYEDFEIGLKFRSAPIMVTTEQIKDFAARFDPQPFHLDEEAGRASLWKGLVASGWHTAALTMRMIVESDLGAAGGTVGGGAEDLRWPRPMRPGDVLHIEGEVVEKRESRTRPAIGIIKVRVTTLNQDGDPVQTLTPVLIVPRRPA